MKGEEKKLTYFMEGCDKRFVIPIYQRNYAWKKEHCRQLFDDLVKTVDAQSESHFFGSIVVVHNPEGSSGENLIIDGQQRLTTTTLLLLALNNLILEGKVIPKVPHLQRKILKEYLVDEYVQGSERIKLRPIMNDFEALKRLFDNDPQDFIEESNLTQNYRFFYEQIQKCSLSPDELFEAIKKLEVICITLNPLYDDPQLIFESLNSTGLRLTEGDKIRNFILMGLDSVRQKNYYENYWNKIEQLVHQNIDLFVRDYLSVKTSKTPGITQSYFAFKKYVLDNQIETKILLEDLLKYARYYNQLLGYNIKDKRLENCIYRLNWLETSVTRPFFLEVLRLTEEGLISADDLLNIFLLTESYIFRRQICGLPTNSMNKTFLALHREILRLDGTADNYLDKLNYAYQIKDGHARFPNDEEFAEAFSTKRIYEKMKNKNKTYIFERLENFGTTEDKNVFQHIENGDFSIEHIMPQTLTPSWIAALGEDYQVIHENWLHRAANLTLTAYNSTYSNRTFAEKRDIKDGFKDSGFRMNQVIAQKEHWGKEELEERDALLRKKVLNIWSAPHSSFVLPQKKADLEYSLSDEDVDLANTTPTKFVFRGVEIACPNWRKLYYEVVSALHQEDKSVLYQLVNQPNSNNSLKNYFAASAQEHRTPIEIDVNLYAEQYTGTNKKLALLRSLFQLYEVDPGELVFYIVNESGEDKE